MRRSDFLTRKERLRIKWSHLRFFIYKIFHKISRLQNWEIEDVIKIKPKKKGVVISGNLIHKDGRIEIL